MRALIFSPESRGALLAGRTERSLRGAGLTVHPRPVRSPGELAAILCGMDEPIVIIRAGAWFVRLRPSAAATSELSTGTSARETGWNLDIPRSATGRPLIALGLVRAWPEERAWAVARRNDPLRRCGGDFDRARWPWWSRFAEPASLYLEPAPAHQLAHHFQRGMSLSGAVKSIIRDSRFRAVHVGDLDVHYDPELRSMQLITSIQIGGAERVVLDLADELKVLGHTAFVAALGGGSRRTLPPPEYFFDLSDVPNVSHTRAAAVEAISTAGGIDIVHGHLIRSSEARAIKSIGIPLVISMHNLRAAWPEGFAMHDPERCDLILACSQAVEHAVGAADLGVPVRTVWNGIDARKFEPRPESQHAGGELRQKLGWHVDDFVVIAVANPRPQKRLDRLPEIVRHVRERLRPRKVRLLWVGELAASNREAVVALRAFNDQLRQWLEPGEFHLTGAMDDVWPALAAADVLVSVSAFEGLSVAQLEALAAGLPVVATSVGGATELARYSREMTLLKKNVSAVEFAETLVRIAANRRELRSNAVPQSFTRRVMSCRTAEFYAATIARCRGENKNAVWLITNNFATGGAQSSARRLLCGLHERGIPVKAFTIQEQPGWQTQGRRSLNDAGVPCVAIPPPADLDPRRTVARLVEYAAREMPSALLLWNVIASYKVLLAEMLFATRIYDVSPGEMYFHSLEACFRNPRAGVPCFSAKEYGKRLAGLIVKYRAERRQAAQLVGAPVHVISNGVPLRRRARGNGGKVLAMGTAARLSPDKRLEDLIDALRVASPQLGPHVLRIAGAAEHGDREYARALRRRARGLCIEWLGELSDLTAFYDSLDLFVMISEPAGCPNASLEAMAAGLPVIATDHGGASEQIIDRVTGRLVPRYDIAAFAEAILELALDRTMRMACASRAHEHVRRHFSIDAMIESYATLCAGAESTPVHAFARGTGLVSPPMVEVID